MLFPTLFETPHLPQVTHLRNSSSIFDTTSFTVSICAYIKPFIRTITLFRIIHNHYLFAKMAHGPVDPDQFTAPFQLTKGMYRYVYPTVDPKSEGLKATGKVVVITGAGGGLGYVGISRPIFDIKYSSLV